MKFILILFLTIQGSSLLLAKEWEKVEDLSGKWKFSIGDDLDWAEPGYDDSGWEEIYVPSKWEDQGFHGYNGYAWYRKKFKFSSKYKYYSVSVQLGYIDDVDEVYLNGHLIGASGTFPPKYNSAYNAYRLYPVPAEYMNFGGSNVISVRVYDSQLGGGIVHGDVGVFVYSQGMDLRVNFEGEWKFTKGDDPLYKKVDYDDSKWQKVFVPGKWANYGYAQYDGFGWYRIEFSMPKEYTGQKMILVLGKIDDIDEAYINGKLVGSTGDMKDDPDSIVYKDEYSQFRGYYIPDKVLIPGKKNVLAVRVYDGHLDGGIYEGPVGLISQEAYKAYWERKKDKKNFWDMIFGN